MWDNHTNRRFYFSWAGIVLNDSDQLLELGEHARLLSYIQYFSVRTVIEFDYSTKIDEFARQLKGIATVETILLKPPRISYNLVNLLTFW